MSAFALIFDNKQRVLLCRRGDVDLWNLPGGKLEPDETPRRAVIREVKEEANIKVQVNRLVGISLNWTRRAIAFAYLCEIAKGKPGANDETDAVGYFASEQFPRRIYPDHQQWIRNVLSNPARFHLTFQSGPSAKRLLKEGKL
jgi:ADP-ribose pyrophosphatase YjhB (NUDIX family)